MKNREEYLKIKGDIPTVSFESLYPTDENRLGKNRIRDFITVGPFVLVTDGAFETEHMYERDKILACDYLADDGGEASVVPYLGLEMKNNFYGPEHLKWMTGYQKWDQLRFDREDEACDDALYATEQRNAVYYAAFYVDCKENSDAIICYENSGCLLYLNGELIDSRPYGRVKGLSSTGYQKAVTFLKGRNLVLFKLRPGYIADTMDLSMTNCTIYPTAVKSGNLILGYPSKTRAYFGNAENAREMFPAFVGALDDSTGGIIEFESDGYSEKIEIGSLNKGECSLARLSSPSKETETVQNIDITFSENGKKSAFVSVSEDVIPYCGFKGQECVFSDFHFDTTYHQEQRTYALGAIHITKCIVQELERNPFFKAVLSEVDYLHPYYSIFPEHRNTIKTAFENARAEADCFYNQPNDLTSSGEGFVRNLVYGQLYHRDVLGRITPVYTPGDVFGHHSQISQICSKGDCISMKWGKEVLGLDSMFHHVSPDGTAMIHDKGVGREDAMRFKVSACDDRGGYVSTMPAYPRENDTSWMAKTATNASYSVFSEEAERYIECDKKETEKSGVSTLDYTSRDLTQHHSGVLLTRTDFKQANRLAENLLISAEKFSTVAALYGAKYPEKALDKAWRQLLCAQHHDSITGTNNEVSFIDLMIEYREALELAGEIIDNAISFLASGVKLDKNETPVFVFNSHTWDRCENCDIILPKKADEKSDYVLCDEKGKEYALGKMTSLSDGRIKTQAVLKAPAMGYKVYFLKKTQKKKKLVTDSGNVIENGFYKIIVDENLGGGIVSIYDKKAKKEIVDFSKDGPANRIAVLREVPDRMETQHEIYTTGQKLFSSDYKAEIKREKTDISEKLEIIVKLDTIARVKQTITLFRGVKRIDMTCCVEDYQSRDDLFTLTFPINTVGGKPIYDDRFAPHICTKSHKKLSFQTHQYASFSQSRIAPVNQWIEVGPTLELNLADKGSVNVGMTSIIRKKNKELIKSCDKLLFALSKKAIPVTPYPDVEQHGGAKIIHFNEDIYSTDTRFVLGINGEDNEYEKKIYSSLKPSFKKKFLSSVETNKTSVLFVRDSDNIYKKPVDVFVIKSLNYDELNKFISSVSEVLEKEEKITIKKVYTDEKIGKADDYGVALINNGTISCSVEPDNMLNMMLFHTADFYGNQGKTTGGEQLIPERKTHMFTYALYPHEGSYRHAGVYKKALEFNDCLFSVADAEQKENSFLPTEKSFVKCSDGFVITTIKAGGYPMASMKGDFGSIEKRGLTLRGFEADGINKNVKLKFGFNIDDVKLTDLLEENGKDIKSKKNGFEFNTGAYSIDTFTFKAEKQETIAESIIGAEREKVEPTYTRSWEHDLGSMPMGYFAFVGTINKKIESIGDNTYRLTVNAVNNRVDKRAKGTMHLNSSDGFVLSKSEFDYDLAEREAKVFEITVKKPSENAKGILRLEYSDDGQNFEDVFEFGYFNPDISLKIEDGRIKCSVFNRTDENLNGEIALATPFETWGIGEKNICSSGSVSPYTQKLEIAAGERKNYYFDFAFEDGDILNSFWAVAKLMVNGRIHFAYDCVKGEHHNVWAHEFRSVIWDDNGSIRRLLEM